MRASRLGVLFGQPDLRLAAFDLDVLRTRPGWEHSFAATIGDLERAGIGSRPLRDHADARAKGVAELWERLDAAAGSSWTAAQTIRRATTELMNDPSIWPFGGPVLAEVTGHEPAVIARFVHTIPRISVVRVAA